MCIRDRHQMKIGNIWQDVLGTYKDFKNLGVGHETGLDIISIKRKIIIELKNRTNTDNSSSRKANLDKLAKFKKTNPDYTCIYGNINDNTEEKTVVGMDKIIIHDGVEIHHMVGMRLINLILGEYSAEIIQFVKDEIDKYI